MEKIIHFNVGNGNCSVIQLKDFLMIIDLNHSEDSKSSYEMLEPYLRVVNNIRVIDVLIITHGDEDHCKDFKIIKEKIDNGELIVGAIGHQGYDRRLVSKIKDLPLDYLMLQEEIDRRKKIENNTFGNIQIALRAKNDERVLFNELKKPENLSLKILSPFDCDNETSDYSHNELSVILNVEVSGLRVLYTSDASSKYWQTRIVPELLQDEHFSHWAKSDILEVGHHGSYDFFGEDRDTVRESSDYPDNYEALSYISPNDIIVSAESRFPINGDCSGDSPPHYAAWKWYHRWFRDNRGINEDDKHPNCFKYTSDGSIKIEYSGFTWTWDNNWDLDES
ncbi:MAG TPA: hypothetical protein DEQ09_12875, partial [Bacteroidales bacterium]|nr:hypothetical protein [Bacteroidales bacterium]